MKSLEFIKEVRKRVIESDINYYLETLEKNENSKDPIWAEIILIYKGLTKEQRRMFIEFIRLVKVNTVSHIFGILDGSTFFNEEKESFILMTQSDKEILNGDLQDVFLELEENV